MTFFCANCETGLQKRLRLKKALPVEPRQNLPRAPAPAAAGKRFFPDIFLKYISQASSAP
jgi:hypothetical protein